MNLRKIDIHKKREYVRWACRLFGDREAENESVLSRNLPDTQSLRKSFLESEEYLSKNIDLSLQKAIWV